MWMGHGGRFLKGNTYRREAQGFAEVGLYMCARSCTCGFAHPHVNHVHQGMLHLVLWIWLNACVSVYKHICEKACIYVVTGCCVYTGDYSCVHVSGYACVHVFTCGSLGDGVFRIL